MSRKLFSLNADLQRLRDEGYFVQIRGGMLIMRDVPYVNSERRVRSGTLISTMTLAGDLTQRPDTHVVNFDGEFPCFSDGTPIKNISHAAGDFDLGHGVTAKFSFSSKPTEGYTDYYHKMTTYASILAGPAEVLDPKVSPRTFRQPEEEEDSVFNYTETASDRVGIGALTERLKTEKVAVMVASTTSTGVPARTTIWFGPPNVRPPPSIWRKRGRTSPYSGRGASSMTSSTVPERPSTERSNS